MSNAILVLNAGSSSLKFTVYRQFATELEVDCKGQVSGIGTHPRFEAKSADGQPLVDRSWPEDSQPSHEELLGFLIDWIEEHSAADRIVAAGHRVVHGGDRFTGPALINEGVLDQLEALVPLAPLHQPHNLRPIRALAKLHPGLPQVACFDTAFHRTQPEVASRFALPRELHDQGVRRYGFHGLSYEFVSQELARLDPALAEGRIVVAHLGSGASMCAIRNGASIESTMGFTALDGLIMGTRCGTLDAGVVLHLIARCGLSPAEVERMLYHKSGLLGVSGISNDMRDLLESDAPEAFQAVELFVHRISRELGGLSASLGGLDALVFTAGIGERSSDIRSQVGEKAAWLGVTIDAEANTRPASEPRRISAPDSRIPVWVVPTDEERMIALHTLEVLDSETDRDDSLAA